MALSYESLSYGSWRFDDCEVGVHKSYQCADVMMKRNGEWRMMSLWLSGDEEYESFVRDLKAGKSPMGMTFRGEVVCWENAEELD